ncbi:MAG: prolyl oligopeptidase family serine peptidase [Halobacteriales archaeon]|nr:prolyl oligopeptidase family serine peptidase [Halobacteriales archaeon]
MRAASGLGLLLVLPVLAAAQGSDVVPFAVIADGETALGWLAIPHAPPTQLVAVCHGHHVHADEHIPRLAALADQGVLAVAMDYRGAFGFNVMAGAHDTIAALDALKADFPSVQHVFLLGISMGGEVCGMVAAQRPDLAESFVAVEPLSMLHETWLEATVAGSLAGQPDAAGEIEREAGGTPLTAPDAYVARSPALLAGDMRLQGAIIVHAVGDGTVPYDQGRELALALAAHGIPVEVGTVLRSIAGDSGTTLLDDAGAPNPLGLAGHGYEADGAQTVIAAGDAALARLLAGHHPSGYHEALVDAELGAIPLV